MKSPSCSQLVMSSIPPDLQYSPFGYLGNGDILILIFYLLPVPDIVRCREVSRPSICAVTSHFEHPTILALAFLHDMLPDRRFSSLAVQDGAMSCGRGGIGLPPHSCLPTPKTSLSIQHDTRYAGPDSADQVSSENRRVGSKLYSPGRSDFLDQSKWNQNDPTTFFFPWHTTAV